VKVWSQEGVGSTFSILLPIAPQTDFNDEFTEEYR
jgi:hypothetical protein